MVTAVPEIIQHPRHADDEFVVEPWPMENPTKMRGLYLVGVQ